MNSQQKRPTGPGPWQGRRAHALVLALVSLPVLAADPAALQPLDCLLEPFEVVEVSSAVEGVIEQIHVDRNDVVSQGQLLVKLDDEVERAQVQLAAARAALITNIQLRETELSFNERTEDRMEQLYKKNTISEHVRDEAGTDTKKSKLQLRNAREAKRLAELELAKAEAILALRSMTSPIDGVVVGRHKVAGEFVEDESILRIAQLNPLKVQVIVPVEMFGKIEEGMEVEVLPEHAGRAALTARVTMVDRVIDPTSGTFDVTAELDNPDHAIPSGLHCTAQFLEGTGGAENVAESSDERIEQPGRAEELVTLEPGAPSAELVVDSTPALDTEPRLQTVATEQEKVPKCATSEVKYRYFLSAVAADNNLEVDDLKNRIEAAGLDNAYIRNRGTLSERVMLGVFSRRDSVDWVLRTMDAADVSVVVEPRPDTGAADQCAARPMYANNHH